MQIEEKINIDQTEIQKRQIRIDSYPYKREIYCHVFTVLDLCHQLQDILKSVDLFSKEPAQLMKFFKVLQDQYVPDTKKALWSMREAEYVLPSNISSVVIDIRKNYDSMCAHFITPANISIVLTQHEMETRMNEIKKHNIREAIACCDRIVKHAAFLESIMPLELDISNLSR